MMMMMMMMMGGKDVFSMNLTKYVYGLLLLATAFQIYEAAMFHDRNSCETFCQTIPTERGSDKKLYPQYSRYMTNNNKCRCYFNDAATYDVYNDKGESSTGGPGLSNGVIRIRIQMKTKPITGKQECIYFCTDIPIEPGTATPKYKNDVIFKAKGNDYICYCRLSGDLEHYDEYKTKADGTMTKISTDPESQQKVEKLFVRYRDESIDALKADRLISGHLTPHQSSEQLTPHQSPGHPDDHRAVDVQRNLEPTDNRPFGHQHVHNHGHQIPDAQPDVYDESTLSRKETEKISHQVTDAEPDDNDESTLSRKETKINGHLITDERPDTKGHATSVRKEKLNMLPPIRTTITPEELLQQGTELKSVHGTSDRNEKLNKSPSKATTITREELLQQGTKLKSVHGTSDRNGNLNDLSPKATTITRDELLQQSKKLKSFPAVPTAVSCDQFCKEIRYIRGLLHHRSCQCIFGNNHFSVYYEGTFRYSNVSPVRKPGNERET